MAVAQQTHLAKRLALLILEAGEAGIPELREALQHVLRGKSKAEQRRFLRLFHKVLAREIQKDSLTIESPTGVEAGLRDQLVEQFQQQHPRTLQVTEQRKPDLIGGLRVRMGDTVYDASLSAKLQRLGRNLH